VYQSAQSRQVFFAIFPVGSTRSRRQGVIESGQIRQQASYRFDAAMWFVNGRFVVADDHSADAIVVVQGLPGCRCCDFRRSDRLQPDLAAEKHILGLIDHDQGQAFTFFAKYLGVRFVFSRGYPPVDGADVVAGLVGAYFGKVDSAAPEFRQTIAAVRPAHEWGFLLQVRGVIANGQQVRQAGVRAAKDRF
jgi:hypothetical protein